MASGAWLGLLLAGMTLIPRSSRVRAGEPEVDPLTAEDLAAMAVFDELGVRSLSGLPYVHIVEGPGTKRDWVGNGDEAEWDRAPRGFLIEQGRDAVTILEDGWIELRLGRRDGSLRRDWRVESLDLLSEVDERIARAREPEPDPLKDPEGAQRVRRELFLQGQAFGEDRSPFLTRVALARACAQVGERARAHELLVATPWREFGFGPREEPSPSRLRQRLLAALHKPWMSRAVWALADRTTPLVSVLPAMRAHIRTWPDSTYAVPLSELIAVAERMVKDEARRAATAKPTEAMTQRERVDDLVFRLREQSCETWVEPGGPTIWGDVRGDESPAAMLARLGHVAVPALLDAMEDRTLTRTVGSPPHVIRVGDAAAAVLGRIAGMSFGERDTLAYDRAAGRSRDVALARAWWAELSTGVERARLNAGVAAGDERALQHARRLCWLYPEDVVGAVTTALRASTDAGIRRSLVELLCREIPGDAQRDVLLGILRHADEAEYRISAAGWLHAHGESAALPEALRIWGLTDGRQDSGTLVRFLVGVRTAGVVTALLSGLDRRSLESCLEVLDAAGSLLRSERGPPVPVDVRSMWEDFLLTSLDDTRPTGNRSILEGDFTAVERVADRAAQHLAALLGRDPSEKAIWKRAPAERDAAVAGIRTAWTHRHEATAPSGPR